MYSGFLFLFLTGGCVRIVDFINVIYGSFLMRDNCKTFGYFITEFRIRRCGRKGNLVGDENK